MILKTEIQFTHSDMYIPCKHRWLASIGGIGVPGTIAKDEAENAVPSLRREGTSRS